MASLFTYAEEVQTLIRDQSQQYVDPGDIYKFINRARREIAMRAQCLRVLTPISGSVLQIAITNAGSGYTAPVLTITPPDAPNGAQPYPGGLQATGMATQIGGAIVSGNVIQGGSGYFQPQVTITDTHGTGATAIASITPINQTVTNQEVYAFSDIDLSPFPGIGEILAVRSVSILYADYRYSLAIYDFSTYQARIRQYPNQYYYVPVVGAQFGQGAGGSFYLYPIASQPYQMEFDCLCLPSDLLTDQDYEPIPSPWTDAVQYWATNLAYLSLQNANFAKMYRDMFDEMMHRYGAASRPGRQINPYGRP